MKKKREREREAKEPNNTIRSSTLTQLGIRAPSPAIFGAPFVSFHMSLAVLTSYFPHFSLFPFDDQETAFWCVVAIVEHILPKGYYTNDMIAVQADQRVLKGTFLFNVFFFFFSFS
jgi:hypothetical protein